MSLTAGAPLVRRRSMWQRAGSPTVLAGLLGAVALGSGYMLFAGPEAPPKDATMDAAPQITVHRDAHRDTPPPAVAPIPASILPPPLPALPVDTPPPAEAAPSQAPDTGSLFRHYASAAVVIPNPGAEAMAGPSAASRPADAGLTFTPAHIVGGETVRITDLARTLKPTTRIPCVLDQAIDGTHPGPLDCHVASPILAWDNDPSHVLLPAGTPIMGTYQPLSTGQDRMMAMAAMAYRSDGLVVPLGGDPMTDDLGQIGMPGHVNTRFWARVGNAIITDAALMAVHLPETALQSRSNGVNFNASSTQGVVSQVLQSTVNLPPTFHKNQGETIMILVTQPVHFGAIRYVAAP